MGRSPAFNDLGVPTLPPSPLPAINPAIIKLTDGLHNFKRMKIAERDAFHLAMKNLVGVVKDSELMHGGDLCVFPSSLEQQAPLLKTTVITGRNISCSLPLSSTTLKGVIFGVPVSDYEEDILEALIDQNVVRVKKLPLKGQPDTPSETILLNFKLLIAYRVKIVAISYRVHQFIPTPLRCKKCWRLGHYTSRCSSLSPNCKKCRKSTPSTTLAV